MLIFKNIASQCQWPLQISKLSNSQNNFLLGILVLRITIIGTYARICKIVLHITFSRWQYADADPWLRLQHTCQCRQRLCVFNATQHNIANACARLRRKDPIIPISIFKWLAFLGSKVFLKTDSGYLQYAGVDHFTLGTPEGSLGLDTPLVASLYQPLPSPFQGGLGRGPSHQCVTC